MDETKCIIQFVIQNHEHMCVFNVAPIWETFTFKKLSQISRIIQMPLEFVSTDGFQIWLRGPSDFMGILLEEVVQKC